MKDDKQKIPQRHEKQEELLWHGKSKGIRLQFEKAYVTFVLRVAFWGSELTAERGERARAELHTLDQELDV